MKLKKICAVFLASVVVAGLTACSGTGSAQATSADTAKVESDKGEEAPKDAPKDTQVDGEKKKVTAWAWDKNFNIAALEEAEALYEAQNPDVDIEIVEFAQADIIQKLNTGLSSGSTEGLPNVVLIEDYRSQTFLKSYPGSFKDLSTITSADSFSNYKLDFMTLDSKVYGVPFDTGSAALFYRKDLIEQAGYTEGDMQNLTWEKYIEIGKAVKEKTGAYMLTLDPNDIGQVRIMMQSAGSWYVKEDGVTPDLEGNQALKDALAIYKEMIDSGISKTISEWAQFVAAPNSGEVATVPTGCWFTPSIMAEGSQSGLWGVAPIPKLGANSASVNASNIGGSSWYVLDQTKNSDVAVEFLAQTFGSNTDLYQNILTKAGVIATYIPAQTGKSYDQEVEFFGNQKIYTDISGWGKQIPAVNYGLHTYAFEDIIKAELQKIIAGESIDTCLASAQKQAESQIK